MSAPENQPSIDLYTRNGFAGPAATMVKMSYSPTYTRVQGTYRPQRLCVWNVDDSITDAPRGLPVPLLRSSTVRLDLWHRKTDTPYALRDVFNDQLIFVEGGHGRLETDFGVLDLEPLDIVVVPRAVSYRLSAVDSLRMLIVVTPEILHLDPENAAVLNPVVHVDLPRAYDPSWVRTGEQELVIRHGDETTSYFYDYDPLPVLHTAGTPVVQRFNLRNVKPIVVEGGDASPPARLIAGADKETLAFYLGARTTQRPPIHHNADYDEVGIYSIGPGAFGHMRIPGTIVWVPKGVIHQGPDENVPEGYVAWLVETRANLELTPQGAKIAELAETSLFGVHPSETADPDVADQPMSNTVHHVDVPSGAVKHWATSA